MTLVKKIELFFRTIEEIWDIIPGYVKVFAYSTISSTFGLWVIGQLDIKAVVIIVATNLGIYQAPRVGGNQIMKLINRSGK